MTATPIYDAMHAATDDATRDALAPVTINTGLMEGLDELRQACAAHRRVFLDEGFSETAAEAMTIEFHARLLRGA